MAYRHPAFFQLLATAVLCLGLAAPAGAQGEDPAGFSVTPTPRVGFSPPRFELEWDGKGSTESLSVLNVSDTPLSVAVTVGNWDLDEENRNRELPPTEQSLDQWMIVNPLQFTIEPGGSQTVRFAIRPRVQPAPGEHRAMIYLAEQPTEAADGEQALRVSFNFGIPVYLHVGEKRREGTLHGIALDSATAPRLLQVDFSSTGTAYARLDAHYMIWPRSAYPGDEKAAAAIRSMAAEPDTAGQRGDGRVFARLPGTPVLPGYRRTLQLPIIMPDAPGDYVLAVSGRMGDVNLWQTLPFSRPGD